MTLIWTALIAMGVLALVACVHSVLLSKRMAEKESVLTLQIEQLSRELAAVNSAAIGVGQRMLVVDKKLKQFTDKLQHIESRQDGEGNYRHAASLAESGAVIEQLVDKFGFTEAEASLLSRINAKT